MQTSLLVRLVTSPPLPGATIDDLRRRLAAAGTLLACLNDDDLNISVISFRAELPNVGAALASLFEKIGEEGSAARAFRLDLQTPDPATALTEEAVRAIAVDVHGKLRSPVYIARRSVPAAAWKKPRAMGWGRDGLGQPQNAPVLPYSSSRALGVAIEIGPPSLLVKVQLIGVSEAQAERVLAAVGGPDGGFADVAAYIVGEQRDERWFCVLELSDVKRTPPARVLQVLEIELRRYGGRLGGGALLSHVPLQTLLDTLAFRTGLSAAPAQIIETHLGVATNA